VKVLIRRHQVCAGTVAADGEPPCVAALRFRMIGGPGDSGQGIVRGRRQRMFRRQRVVHRKNEDAGDRAEDCPAGFKS